MEVWYRWRLLGISLIQRNGRWKRWLFLGYVRYLLGCCVVRDAGRRLHETPGVTIREGKAIGRMFRQRLLQQVSSNQHTKLGIFDIEVLRSRPHPAVWWSLPSNHIKDSGPQRWLCYLMTRYGRHIMIRALGEETFVVRTTYLSKDVL